MTTNFKAYLEIILGSMFSGKTSRLVEIYKQCKFCNIPVIVVNHSCDNRYDDELLSTHDKIKIPCIKTNSLYEFWHKYYFDNDSLLSYQLILVSCDCCEDSFLKDVGSILFFLNVGDWASHSVRPND